MRIIHCAPFNLFTKIGASLYSNPIKISQGLTQNNHFVHNFDYRDTSRYMSFFRNKKNGQKAMNEFFKNLIDDIKPDLIVFGHAELIEEETFEYIKRNNIRMVFWYNDIPLQSSFKKIAHYFDFILTTAGGDFILDIKQYNDNVFFLPNLVDENIEKYKAYENKSFESDLLFTGRNDSERAALREYLNSNINSNIKIKYLGHSKKSVVIGDAYLQALANSKICINHNRDFTLKNEWYTSDRLFHILGNGSFALSTKILNGEDFFEDKLEYYESFEELVYKVHYFIDHEKERLEKSKWLRDRVHTLFNSKRVSKYILSLYNDDIIDLKTYEWYK